MQVWIAIIGMLVAVAMLVITVRRFIRDKSHQQQMEDHQQQLEDLAKVLVRRTDDLKKAVLTLSAAIGVLAILSLIVQLL